VVPLVSSDLRDDTDKKGVPSKVVDCVYSNELKSKSTRETDFKQFLCYIALQHVEEKHSLKLSRAIAFPNIASKGKLEIRTVLVPVYGTDNAKALPNLDRKDDSAPKVPLIEEIGITTDPPQPRINEEIIPEKPTWSLTKLKNGDFRIELEVPELPRHIIEQAALEVESRRIIFSVGDPPVCALDESFPQISRDFKVDSAKAEWNIQMRRLSILL